MTGGGLFLASPHLSSWPSSHGGMTQKFRSFSATEYLTISPYLELLCFERLLDINTYITNINTGKIQIFFACTYIANSNF